MDSLQWIVHLALLGFIMYQQSTIRKYVKVTYDLNVLTSSFLISLVSPLQQMLYQHTLLKYEEFKDMRKAIDETKKNAPSIAENYNKQVTALIAELKLGGDSSPDPNAVIDDLLPEAPSDGSKPH